SSLDEQRIDLLLRDGLEERVGIVRSWPVVAEVPRVSDRSPARPDEKAVGEGDRVVHGVRDDLDPADPNGRSVGEDLPGMVAVLHPRGLLDRREEGPGPLAHVDRDRGVDQLEITRVVGVRVADKDPVDLGRHVREVAVAERLLRIEPGDPGNEVELEEVLRPAGRPGLKVVHVELLGSRREGRSEVEENTVRPVLDKDLVAPDLANSAEEPDRRNFHGSGKDRSLKRFVAPGPANLFWRQWSVPVRDDASSWPSLLGLRSEAAEPARGPRAAPPGASSG